MISTSLVLSGLLSAQFTLGCKGDKDPTGGGGSGDDTSASQDDTGTGTDDTGTGTDDTGTGTDDTGTVEGDTLTFSMTGTWEYTTLVLTNFDPEALFDAGVITGETHATATAGTDASLDVVMPEPDESHFVLADAETWSDFEVAYYLPTLHVDIDGDGAVSGGESYEGVGLAWPVYAREPIPDEVVSMGVVAGWNAINIMESDMPVVHDISAIPLAATIGVQETLSAAGTVQSGVTKSNAGLALVPAIAMESKGSLSDWEFIHDEPLTDPWTIEVNGAPPSEHIGLLDDMSMEGAIEVALAYTDADTSGSFTDGDQPSAVICDGDDMIAFFWLSGLNEPAMAIQYTFLGWHTGWTGVRLDNKENAILEDSEMLDLVVGTDCFSEG